jgi:hypothetical protein
VGARTLAFRLQPTHGVSQRPCQHVRTAQLTRNKTWHHFYIVARGQHIQAWLNGMKTIDIAHKEGFPDGAIGFELCHGKKHTILTVKTLVVRELK